MTRSINPRTGEPFGPDFPDTTPHQIGQLIGNAVVAFPKWSRSSPSNRARSLNAIADALDAQIDMLVELADQETGLGKVRLTGEVGRTTFQIRSFARILISGEFIQPELDEAVDAPLPTGHPRFLRTQMGLGVVAVFGASNFPFAFSVLGGDTASALAAGCCAVIKAHPAHPQTSQAVFDIAVMALHASGAPNHVISLGHGFAFGSEVMRDPRISAGAFTGSRSGGRALFDMAQSRPNPIPFYGELGSVNPVFVLKSALSDPPALAGAYLDSLLLGNGQFCTNPSVLFLPESAEFQGTLMSQLEEREPQPFLSQATQELHNKNRALLGAISTGTVLVGKRAAANGFFVSAEIHIFTTDQIAALTALQEECFGPTGIVITYKNLDKALEILAKFEGALVGSLFSKELDADALRVVAALSTVSGRVALNTWPTGVAVTRGQHHGGPYPASTSPLHTSVGIHAITRFLRPITYQGFPADFRGTAES